jgi:hypothetical protein
VVVKRQVRRCHVGQVGGDVPVGDLDLAVLHVLGVNELDVVNQVQFFQQYGADQAVKVTAGHQPEFALAYGSPLFDKRSEKRRGGIANAINLTHKHEQGPGF